MTQEPAQTDVVVAFSTKDIAILWSENNGTYKFVNIEKKLQRHRDVPPSVTLCAAKTLLCGTNPRLRRRSVICALKYVIKHDPSPWVRLRGAAALGRMRTINTAPPAYIPESVENADRARYIALSYLIPIEYNGPEAVRAACLRIACPHVYTILLCLQSTVLPNELHLVILNYL
jgi:hypothetical protein